MSMHHRRAGHAIHRRQGPGDITLPTGGPGPTETEEETTPTISKPTQTKPTNTTPTKPPPKPTDTKTETETETKAEETTEKEDTATKTRTSESTKSTESSSSATKSSSSGTTTNTVIPTGRVPVTGVFPTTPVDTELMPTNLPTGTSSENANSQSSALGTGTIVGAVAGGVAGIVLLAVIISFFLRRYRSRRRAEEFDAAQFRRSAMIMDGGEPSSDPRPFSLFGGRWGGHSAAARNSVAGDAGMAGHGAYRNYQDAAPAQPEMAYADDRAPTTSAGLQPRQQYTYGEQYDNAAARDDDYTNGAYSEQPQQQQLYNLEAYGDYQSYAGNGQPQAQYQQQQHQHKESRDVDPYGGI